MKNNNFSITINCSDEETKNAFMGFVIAFNKVEIPRTIKEILTKNDIESDPEVSVVDESTVSIERIATKRGFVLSGEESIVGTSYEDLPVNTAYVMDVEGKIKLFIKTDVESADKEIGYFRSISDAIENFNNEEVKQSIDLILNSKEPDMRLEEETTEEVVEVDGFNDAEVVE